MFDALLWVMLLCPIDVAQEYTNSGRYEESQLVLQLFCKPDGRQYSYLRAVNHYQLNDKDNALKWVNNIRQRFSQDENYPVRYQALANIMFADLETWQTTDAENENKPDVNNIARKMKISENRLSTYKLGTKTEAIQTEILKDLDALLKEKENEAKQQAEEAANAKGKAEAKARQQAGGRNAGQGDVPQQDSFGGQDHGPGLVDQKKLMALTQQWGSLPPKERARAMMELSQRLPAKYQQILEEYTKALSKSDK